MYLEADWELRHNSYFCSGSNFCWETRGLKDDWLQMKEGIRKNPLRDFTQYLNADGWAALKKKLTA
jgi:hypothetical protein